MPKAASELKPVQIARLSAPGLYAVGGVSGLYLRIAPTGARNWILRAMVGGRRRDMGLGGLPTVTLADARDRARTARKAIWEGSDPIETRRSTRAQLRETPTFSACAALYIAAHRAGWKSAKHADQWTNTLATYTQSLAKMPVDKIELQDVVTVLSGLWTTKTETATRLRMRIEAVLAWAIARGYRKGENPARWRGNLDALLPKPRSVTKVKHHRAVSLAALPDFMATLAQRDGTSARALQFLVLTAARSGEVRGATWDEIDGDTWTIPADRMKAGKEHRVPLSPPARALLDTLPRFADSPYLFPSPTGGQLSDMAVSAVMRRMEVDAVPHGFRSTFRDWAAERTDYPRDVAEMALAHTIGDKVEAAYRRGDLFTKRTTMMADWAAFAGGTA